MAVKLSKHIAEMGKSSGLEKDFLKAGLREEDVTGRIEFMVYQCRAVTDLNSIKLADGGEFFAYSLINGLDWRGEAKINEIYRKLYHKASLDRLQSL